MSTLVVKLLGDMPLESIALTGDDTGALAAVISGLDSSRYPYLAFVDPFGTTTFNGSQMRVVIPELLRLRKEEVAAPVRAVIGQALDVARRCQDGVHLYLQFEGD
ncbi:MAG: hypothetical protein ACREMZ_17180 [Gemmatimonadales bacterium]